MFGSKRSGDDAEALALAHLQRAGLLLLARNVRFRGGELDLVMLDGAALVIVEVRKRSHAGYGGALASIDARKRARIVLATQLWLAAHDRHARRPVRFDVISIDGGDRLEWLQAAFDVDG